MSRPYHPCNVFVVLQPSLITVLPRLFLSYHPTPTPRPILTRQSGRNPSSRVPLRHFARSTHGQFLCVTCGISPTLLDSTIILTCTYLKRILYIRDRPLWLAERKWKLSNGHGRYQTDVGITWIWSKSDLNGLVDVHHIGSLFDQTPVRECMIFRPARLVDFQPNRLVDSFDRKSIYAR